MYFGASERPVFSLWNALPPSWNYEEKKTVDSGKSSREGGRQVERRGREGEEDNKDPVPFQLPTFENPR